MPGKREAVKNAFRRVKGSVKRSVKRIFSHSIHEDRSKPQEESRDVAVADEASTVSSIESRTTSQLNGASSLLAALFDSDGKVIQAEVPTVVNQPKVSARLFKAASSLATIPVPDEAPAPIEVQREVYNQSSCIAPLYDSDSDKNQDQSEVEQRPQSGKIF